jgi:AraC-like DNA-binding protein
MAGFLRAPAAPLSDFVDIVWIYEAYAPPHPQERLMPMGAMNLVITWNAHGIWSGVSGVHTHSVLLDTSLPFSIVGVSFKPGGGFPFLPMPAGELQDLSVPLDAVWGRHAHDVCDAVMEADTPARKFSVVEQALLARARGRLERHPAVRYAVDKLGHVQPRTVSSVVEDIGLSQRRFIEVFRKEVGVTPKAYSRVRRFQHVLGCVEHATEVDWSAVALSAGYFDQAHFNHDFRDFAGVSPSNYLRYRASRNHIAVHD